jgi:hypothetical protein
VLLASRKEQSLNSNLEKNQMNAYAVKARHIKSNLVSLASALAIASAQLFALGSAHADSLAIRGQLGKRKIEVPVSMLLGPVTYGPSSKENGLETVREIKDIAFPMRLSNLQPILTIQDKEDWEKSQFTTRPFYLTKWAVVEFDARNPQSRLPSQEKLLNSDPHGPYEKDSTKSNDLTHFKSVKSLTNSPGIGWFEYYFDAGSGTYILCETTRKQVPPYETSDFCTHRFWVAELGLTAEVSYTKEDIPRWKKIEQSIKDTIIKYSKQ